MWKREEKVQFRAATFPYAFADDDGDDDDRRTRRWWLLLTDFHSIVQACVYNIREMRSEKLTQIHTSIKRYTKKSLIHSFKNVNALCIPFYSTTCDMIWMFIVFIYYYYYYVDDRSSSMRIITTTREYNFILFIIIIILCVCKNIKHIFSIPKTKTHVV